MIIFVVLKQTKMKTYKVTYTKAIGGNGSILVGASDETSAINNARNLCHTGRDFRDAIETDQKYIKPRKQGFAGKN
jgi:hypothetical protein